MGHNGGKQLTLKVGRKKVSMVMLKVQREEHDLKPYTQIELQGWKKNKFEGDVESSKGRQ